MKIIDKSVSSSSRNKPTPTESRPCQDVAVNVTAVKRSQLSCETKDSATGGWQRAHAQSTPQQPKFDCFCTSRRPDSHHNAGFFNKDCYWCLPSCPPGDPPSAAATDADAVQLQGLTSAAATAACQPVHYRLNQCCYCCLPGCTPSGLISAATALRCGCMGPTSTLNSDCSLVVRYDRASATAIPCRHMRSWLVRVQVDMSKSSKV